MYVSKKVYTDGMSDKEKEGCMQEVGLLKFLNNPNIVAYKDSFLSDGMIVLVMEYCEGKNTTFCLSFFSW
jgi:NIMA (never in mitosis gene a)-related kinase 1/4/5